jgi:hypothetical protein
MWSYRITVQANNVPGGAAAAHLERYRQLRIYLDHLDAAKVPDGQIQVHLNVAQSEDPTITGDTWTADIVVAADRSLYQDLQPDDSGRRLDWLREQH